MDWADLIAAGMRFHRRGPALKKDLSPITRGACYGVTSTCGVKVRLKNSMSWCVKSHGFFQVRWVLAMQALVDMQVNFELDSFFHTKPVQVFFFLFLILPGCSFRCYHLFSHEAQGRNIPNSMTVGMGFHCLYVPSIT